MPTYEYRCERGHEFERFQKMSDEPISTCPDCGAEAERILSGGGGLLFKGEGFYATDYRSDEYQKKARKEKKGNGASGGGDGRGAGNGGSSADSSGGGSGTGSEGTASGGDGE